APAVQQHGAGTALAVVTVFLRSGQVEVLAQRVQQGGAVIEVEIVRRAVDAQRHPAGHFQYHGVSLPGLLTDQTHAGPSCWRTLRRCRAGSSSHTTTIMTASAAVAIMDAPRLRTTSRTNSTELRIDSARNASPPVARRDVNSTTSSLRCSRNRRRCTATGAMSRIAVQAAAMRVIT